jgi:hypothetical protein
MLRFIYKISVNEKKFYFFSLCEIQGLLRGYISELVMK